MENNKKIFLKQAPEFVKCLGPEASMEKERHILEMNAYKEWNQSIYQLYHSNINFFPTIYDTNYNNCSTLMEYLSPHDGWHLLQDGLFNIIHNKENRWENSH